MRTKKLILNSILSLLYEIVAVICGLILPRLILQAFGTDVNGLVNSISQFLSVISFLDLGVAAVVQSALYKPLADRDSDGISKIVASGGKFFRRIAYILLGYVAVLIAVYPYFIGGDFDFSYTALLILSISISSFAQYYFGVTDRILLTADQRGYVQYSIQIITLILNTIACAMLIQMGFSIQLVKLTTSLIYLVRPIILRLYVNRHYSLNRKIKYEGEPIKQKWNGFAQHISSVVLDGTDTIVLTLFSTLSNVSIYSVYNLIALNLRNFFCSITNGIKPVLGELWAKHETNVLKKFFSKIQWGLHTLANFVFGCCLVLIVPFVTVYTMGISDANYIQPLFAVLITLANFMLCLRQPYFIMVLAAGEYKSTQSCFIVSTILNIVVSILLVFLWGLIGVAIGTLIAMVYQTVWMAIYNSKHLIKGEIKSFVKQIVVDAITVVLMWIATMWIDMRSVSYLSWFIMALEVAGIGLLVVTVVNLLFYRDLIFDVCKYIKRKLSKRKKTS